MKRGKYISLVVVMLCLSYICIGVHKNMMSIKTVSCLAENVVAEQKEELPIRAKSAYLMDFENNLVVYKKNELKRLPIASMCKIMTLILCFEAIDRGDLSFEEDISVSERASSMGGSQVFLETNGKYKTKDLIKSIVICSANDSCVAMSERLAGSEEVFVDKMNEKAEEIGADNTLFSNCTGLPREPQYSCARDVAIMLKELLKHEAYYEFGGVWTDKFVHPKGRFTEITNTNKLIRFYDGCDGGKTGFTNEAGFCLAATAKRGDTRLISVVIGEESSVNRFDDVRTMFDFAFANYKTKIIIDKGELLPECAKVEGGKRENVAVYPEKPLSIFIKNGEKENFSTEIVLKTKKAPIKKEEVVGEIILYKNNVEINRVNLLAAENVKKANFFDNFHRIALNWRKK